jgi:hypothetical protein
MTVRDLGVVDYLVVGAGAMGMAFVDTLMSLQPSATVMLIDSHTAPGGHWNDAYDYVKLHQPSIAYGVNSMQLEGNWAKLLLAGKLPWNHHASKPELLTYYRSVVDSWSQKGHLLYMPSTRYDFTQNPTTQDMVTFKSINDNNDELNNSTTYQVKVNVKVVDAVQGECKVPKTTPPQFTYDSTIQVITPNDLLEQKPVKKTGWLFTKPSAIPTTKYVVVGCGKTGMDAIIYLQTTLHVLPSDITWIIPHDVWMINLERSSPSAYHQALLNQIGNHEAAMDELEKNNFIYRLDPTVRPTSEYKFPTISGSELKTLRTVENKIRHGRVKHIQADDNIPVLHFIDGTELKLNNSLVESTVFIHCSAPGPFTNITRGEEERLPMRLFDGKTITLFPLFAPPITFSGAVIAKLETARRNNTLNFEGGKRLKVEQADDTSASIDGNTLLGNYIQPYYIGSKSATVQMLHHYNLAMFLSLVDNDPMHGAQWLTKNNRVSEFQWLSKLKIVDILQKMISHSQELGYTEQETENLRIVSSIVSPLQGM